MSKTLFETHRRTYNLNSVLNVNSIRPDPDHLAINTHVRWPDLENDGVYTVCNKIAAWTFKKGL
jgi:hypothetical protein